MTKSDLGGPFSNAHDAGKPAILEVTIDALEQHAVAGDVAEVKSLVARSGLTFADSAPAFKTGIREVSAEADALELAKFAATFANDEANPAHGSVSTMVLNNLILADMSDELPGMKHVLGQPKDLRKGAAEMLDVLNPGQVAGLVEGIMPYHGGLEYRSKEVIADATIAAVDKLPTLLKPDVKVADRLYAVLPEVTSIPDYDERYGDVTDKIFDYVSPATKVQILGDKISAVDIAPADEKVSGLLTRFGKTVGDFWADDGSMVRTPEKILGIAPERQKGLDF